jgi:hypothetical protein
VVGELSGSRVRCLRCDGDRILAADVRRENRDDAIEASGKRPPFDVRQPAHT